MTSHSGVQPEPVKDDNRGKYQILMELGRGGAGVVSAAMSRGIGGFRKLVVLKTTRTDLDAWDDESFGSNTANMLLDEARLSARMQHPNIVQVYEVYERAGHPVIVMEYIDGLSLAKIIPRLWRHDEAAPELAVSIVCRVLEALSYAHALTDFGGQSLGLVHRDVSPHNVMVTYDGQVKLLDFGTAKLKKRQAQETLTGVIKGKLGYMPPEQACGMELDARADVFAAGVILWELLAKRRMWANLSDTDIIRELLSDNVPSLDVVAPGLDASLRQICAKALAPRVENRYAGAAVLLGDLQRYLAARGGPTPEAQIAEVIGRTCSDLRQSVQQRLEKEIARHASDLDDPQDVAQAPLVDTGATETLTLEAGSKPARSRIGWAVAVAGVVFGTSVAVQRGGLLAREAPRTLPSPGVTAPATVAVPRDGPAPGPLPAAIRLSVSADPAGARLYLDEQPIENPYRVQRPRDGALHVLRAEMEGYVPTRREVRFDADVDLVFSLGAAAPAPSAAPEQEQPVRTRRNSAPARRAAAKTAKTAAAVKSPQVETASPAAAAAPDCNPPYYFDERGIKQYRRECLEQ